MKIAAIVKRPTAALRHMERYVNLGSPSGFTNRYTTSPRYDPVVGASRFKIPLLTLGADSVVRYGEFPPQLRDQFITPDGLMCIPLHPDMLPRLRSDPTLRPEWSQFYVYPTASRRTVHCCINGAYAYLKLHYDGVLCRIDRKLPLDKAVAGVEVSRELERSIDSNQFASSFSILRERAALVSRRPRELGFVLRDSSPYPLAKRRPILIPAFALFSPDSTCPRDPPLIVQMLNNCTDKHSLLFDNLITPILSAYVNMVKRLGLIPELNAQNILIELDNSGVPTRVVLRDLMGTYKDIPARLALGLTTNFDAGLYKCISTEIDTTDYYIRRSFGYDFKLCKYVLEPILMAAKPTLGASLSDLVARVRETFLAMFGSDVKTYFQPYDLWYDHPKILLTEARPYITHVGPKYR